MVLWERTLKGGCVSFIPTEWCWTDRLEAFAQGIVASAADAERRGLFTRLGQDRKARRQFLAQWDVRAAQFARCEDAPDSFLRDPEGVDGAIIELAPFCARFSRSEFPGLYRIADEITAIAHRTRPLRQQFHLAAHRAPADA